MSRKFLVEKYTVLFRLTNHCIYDSWPASLPIFNDHLFEATAWSG